MHLVIAAGRSNPGQARQCLYGIPSGSRALKQNALMHQLKVCMESSTHLHKAVERVAASPSHCWHNILQYTVSAERLLSTIAQARLFVGDELPPAATPVVARAMLRLFQTARYVTSLNARTLSFHQDAHMPSRHSAHELNPIRSSSVCRHFTEWLRRRSSQPAVEPSGRCFVVRMPQMSPTMEAGRCAL